ncbi:SDR family NAD(P)-dependent oxidoreductase [Marinicrinis sediminis]|uniref:SDR family NAD(P)-dependent oxidoreductase n=1 Tax=Marinicrinis sediminis TaxID=1652465 RepID=A0ABW5R6E6_9BACL
MTNRKVMLITGTRKGIGRYLVEYYTERGYEVIGCSRGAAEEEIRHYHHYCLDVADEPKVKAMFADIAGKHGHVDVLVNNAGIASMNHLLLTPLQTVENIFSTNVFGTFLFCREAAKLMRKSRYGRIVNFATVATPLRLEGEAVYAASKAAVSSLTEVMARELAPFRITVNAVGPTPVKTDLIRSVPQAKMDALIDRQAVKRFGEFRDISNVIDFFIREDSDFVTGQIVYLGGVS